MEWIKIEELSRFLNQFQPKQIHPDDPKWWSFWREMKRKVIEGVWFEDFGKWRYGRGNLGFYHHYCTILDVDDVQKTYGKKIKPLIRDLEWHRSYYMMEARGFSGFSKDDKYTSDYRVFDVNINKFPKSDPNYNLYFTPDDKLKEFIPPRENLFRLHDSPVGFPLYRNESKNIVELGSRGGGKATPLYSKIPTPKGWVKMGDLSIGDLVFNRDGRPTKVVQVHPQGKKEIYEVHLKDGRVVECCKDHLWTVKYGEKEQTLSTQELYNKGLYYQTTKNKIYKFKVPICDAVEYSEKDLPIDPYVLGCLLGDGALTTNAPKIAVGDPEILTYLEEKLEGFEFSYDTSTNNNYTIVDINKDLIYIDSSKVDRIEVDSYYKKGGNRLVTKLRQLNLNKSCKEKFIPEQYMQSSIEQRLELLRGLLDTDGSCTKNGLVEFTSTNKQLAEQVLLLARSLGIACSFGVDNRSHIQHQIKGRVCFKPYSYRVYINTTLPVFKISSKLNRLEGKKVTSYQTHTNIIDIVPTGRHTDMQCITVDCDDHTYLTDDYVVTHNSLYYVLAEIKYELCTNGLKYYDDPKYKPRVLIDVGSGIKGKSLKTLNSLKYSMNELAVNPDKGVWGEPNDSGKIYEPCPFYKIMEGSFNSDAKEGWTNQYDVKIGNNWSKKGDGSSIFHRVYSTNRKTGAEAGAGGRRNIIMYEEIGLFEELLTTWGSDDAVVKIDGVQFGVKAGIGTSGNMDTIKYAQTIFTHPDDYNCLKFPTKDGESHQCFFLPAYMADKRFKDKNGNTDIEAAKKHYEKYHEEKDKTGRQDVIIAARTNYPIEVDHMWISQQGKLLPYQEADRQEKKLLKDNLYESIGTAVELYWDEVQPNGVNYRMMHNAVPFYDDNISQRTNLDGCVMIYEHPVFIKGQVPKDAYIITHDPYVSDNVDEGGSLGTTHVWVNPKYYSHVTTPLAATYIGKHPRGLDFYNQNLEKLVAYYGNPIRGLWYEAIRGERLRSYFIRKNKAHLLCLQPAYEQGSHIYLRHTNKTGFSVGNRISKITMVDRLHDLLLEEVEMNGTVTKVIFLINCIFTIRQIKAYDLDGNYDAVSSALGWPLALGEIEHRITEKLHKRNNPMSLFTKGFKR